MTCLFCGSNVVIKSQNYPLGPLYCSICNRDCIKITVSTNIIDEKFYVENDQVFGFRARSEFYNKFLIYGRKSYYFNAFNKLKTELSIRTLVLDSEHWWLRDRIFDASEKIYLPDKRTLRVAGNQVSFPPYIHHGDNRNVRRNFQITNRYISLVKSDQPNGYYDDPEFSRLNDELSHNSPELNLSKMKRTARPLEGGNYFCVENMDGVTWYIIGENVLLNELDLQNFKCLYQKFPDFIFWDIHRYQLEFNKIIAIYKKIFNTEYVIYIPQWAYHIDLQMAYIGKGVFLLHCFEEGEKFWEVYRKDPFFVMQGQKFKALIGDVPNELDRQGYRNIINIIAAKLEACNFKVIKFCGCIFQERSYESKLDENLDVASRVVEISDGGCLASFFTNGFHYYSSQSNQHYFITLNSPFEFYKNYLRRILFPLKITPIFIDMDDAKPGNTPVLIEQQNLRGAVRCQMNWINRNKLSELGLANLGFA